MNVSIMQPYLFPHIGYFQLMASADVFVIHDDVQYIKGGWINRNRILSTGEPRWVTLPVAAGAHRLNINQRSYAPGSEGPSRFLRHLEAAYRAAPNFAEVFALVKELLNHEDRNVAVLNTYALCRVAESIGITTPIVISSEMTKDESLRGEDRVIAICEALSADRYVNARGGTALYHHDRFADHGLELVVSTGAACLPAVRVGRRPSLSIIDVLMFNDAATIGEMLEEFRLVAG